MSKYIRTLNGVVDLSQYKEVREKEARFDIYCAPIGEPSYWFRIDKKVIVKQADTIEELCDEFVLINKNIDLLPSIEKSYHDFSPYLDVDIRRHEKPSYIEIYGAIWTDKGLIYVAKMNEKGEFELL